MHPFDRGVRLWFGYVRVIRNDANLYSILLRSTVHIFME